MILKKNTHTRKQYVTNAKDHYCYDRDRVMYKKHKIGLKYPSSSVRSILLCTYYSSFIVHTTVKSKARGNYSSKMNHEINLYKHREKKIQLRDPPLLLVVGTRVLL